ncbi:alkaline phosphatase family protein [Mycobacterium sp.]|uniref:alkaline phosphatase family protein n=1 Tax=Mycobacterium sp. TaxID=1785 RepID=UPI002BF9BD4A|nr:alkaline phosphatase family protein [Mycobacterium sp.]HME48295.1 alkaline phosphatase family protein [Mycobacterium sp.]
MTTANQLGSVEHIVVLVLENRSFDHMLGFLYADSENVSPLTKQPFEGLTGKESNSDATGTSIPVTALAQGTPNVYFTPGADPGEGFLATNMQLFGKASPTAGTSATNSGFVTDFAATLKSGHVDGPIIAGTTASDIMRIFSPELLPVLSGLARGFAVCDHWFSSVPTETFPNRAFLCAATSQGHMDDSTAKYTTQSIFGLLSAHHLDWSIYGYDAAPLTRLDFPDTTNAPQSHFGVFRDFQAAAAAGSLGAYTFLEPSWGSSGNSQHPNYDVSLGEQLIHDVYYALRNGPAWHQTLLVVTYDEHGGCYDHVPPPTGAVPPDSCADTKFGFDFTRFGVRVPAVLVSPLIAPGTVFRPSGTVPLDHTSILKTVETRWNLPPLTARDAAAPDVGDVLTLAQARTDDPLAGVTIPRSTTPNPVAGTPSHIQEVMAQLVSELPVNDAQGQGYSAMPALTTEQDYDDYINSRYAAWTAQRATAPS